MAYPFTDVRGADTPVGSAPIGPTAPGHTAPELIAIMTEVRDATRVMGDFLNHRAHGCRNGSGFGVESMTCACPVGKRLSAAWSAFHAALRSAGVPE